LVEALLDAQYMWRTRDEVDRYVAVGE